MAARVFADAVREAYALARGGHYQPAETLCGELLRERADNAELWLLRGIIQIQTGRPAQAVTAIRESMRRGEARAATHVLLGDALSQSGEAHPAIESYDRATTLNPGLVNAHLGKGRACLDTKQPEQALFSFEAALALAPGDADVWCGRALALFALGRIAEAQQNLNQSLTLRPDYALALASRGAARLKMADPSGALQDLDAALSLEPHFIEALCNRGAVLRQLSRPDEALAAYETAIKLKSQYLPALRGRAETLRELRRSKEALEAFVDTLQLFPGDAETLRGEGDALLDLSRSAEALAAHEQAVRHAPDSSDGFNSLGNSLYALQRFDAAIEAYQRALALESRNAVAHVNLGTALFRVGADPQGVIEHLSAALAIRPEFPNLPGLRAYAKRCVADWTFTEADAEQLARMAREKEPVAAPFHLLGIVDSPEALQRCAETYLGFRLPRSASPCQPTERDSHKLRIAYVSSDFREHAVARLMSGVFEQHDRNLCEVIGVSLAPQDDSELGRRVRAAFDRCIDVSALHDDEAVHALRALNIDIAVDLNGLTDGARTALFKERVAPLQVNYLGFPGTSGASFMDYIVADDVLIPPGEDCFYHEQVVRLPCFQAYDDTLIASPGTDRASEGLPAEGFVFCCFNHTSKITPTQFDAWVKILMQVPGSVLWLLACEPLTRLNLRREATRRGLDPARLIFAGRVSRAAFRSRLRVADLFLDTLPFNAGATASEVLAAGLPLLTTSGRSFASRMAGSLLLTLGLPEFICHDLAEYESRAVHLAQNPQELSKLRGRLALRSAAGTLFDTRTFARVLEQAFEHMHQRRLSGLPPASFRI